MMPISKSPHPPLIVIWQSLVVAGYRSFFYELQKSWQGPIYLVAPERFVELGSQSRVCDSFDQTAVIPPERCFMIPIFTKHVQVVWFRGLSNIIAKVAKSTSQTPAILCIAEPYSFTALFCYLQASLALKKKFPFFTYALQNIDKDFALPISLVEQFLLRRCKAVLSLGPGQTNVLRSHGFRGPAIDFPLWFDSRRFGARIPKDHALSQLAHSKPLLGSSTPNERPTIGFCGSMFEEKGVFDLLSLFENNKEFRSRYRLVLAGLGRSLDQVLTRATALVAQGTSITHFGGLQLDAMPAFYSIIDVLAVPSRTAPNWKEQFGRIIVEAQSCGTVVVGSDSGEIPYVINDHMRIFGEGNVGHMEKCLVHALSLTPTACAKIQMENTERFSDVALAKLFSRKLESFLH